MIAAGLLGAVGVALFALGTPRQADLAFGRRTDKALRVRLRIAGAVLLGAALPIATTQGDLARTLMAWVGTVGFVGLALALGFTTLAQRR